MGRYIKYFLITIFFIFSSELLAQEKIVVLDLNYVLNQSKAGKGAQDFLKKSYTQNIEKFKDIENGLKKEETDLLSKKSVLSKEDGNNRLHLYNYIPGRIIKNSIKNRTKWMVSV